MTDIIISGSKTLPKNDKFSERSSLLSLDTALSEGQQDNQNRDFNLGFNGIILGLINSMTFADYFYCSFILKGLLS